MEELNKDEEVLENQTDDAPQVLPEEIDASDLEKLQDELEESKKLNAEYLDKLQRSLAEFDNFRKRTAVEKTGMYDSGIADTVDRLLPVIDNFERAISAVEESFKSDNFYKGIEMIYTQTMETFTALGVEEIEGVGAEFDPNCHNAVLHVEDEHLGENQVAEVLQKGYKFKEKVIRPSMVKVAN